MHARQLEPSWLVRRHQLFGSVPIDLTYEQLLCCVASLYFHSDLQTLQLLVGGDFLKATCAVTTDTGSGYVAIAEALVVDRNTFFSRSCSSSLPLEFATSASKDLRMPFMDIDQQYLPLA